MHTILQVIVPSTIFDLLLAALLVRMSNSKKYMFPVVVLRGSL